MLEKILSNRFIIIYLAPFILGSLTVFSFQPFNFSLINFIIFPLTFSLIVYVKKRSISIYRKSKSYKKNLFLIGFLFGFGYFLCGTFWISYSLTFEENFKFLIPISIILIPAFLGLFTAIATLAVGRYLNFNFISILLFSSSFAVSDYIRGKIFTGFPWNLVAYSWSWLTEILQILNFLGLYAFNLVIITIFTLPALLFLRIESYKKVLTLSLIFIFGFLTYIYGSFAINKNKALINSIDNKNKIYVKVVSPNFELKYDHTIEEIEKKLELLIKYSDPESNQKTLFIWPEGVFTGYSFKEINLFKKLVAENLIKITLLCLG